MRPQVSLYRTASQPEGRLQRLRWMVASTAASVGLHLLAILVLLALAREPPRAPRLVWLPSEAGQPAQQVVPYLVPAPAAQPGAVPRRRPPTGLGIRVLPEPEPATRPSLRAGLPPLPPSARRDSAAATVAARAGTHRLLRPGYGDGRLWVPPIDILELGRRLPAAPGGEAGAGPPSVAQLDSTVTARLKAFLDTMPPDSFAPPQTTRWTTEINGKTWGIDGQWIYLGGLKLPAALLALLPFPQGNIDQSRAAAELMRMREDIVQAAQRAQTAAEFRKYVSELRKRKDQERQAKQQAPRDTVIP